MAYKSKIDESVVGYVDIDEVFEGFDRRMINTIVRCDDLRDQLFDVVNTKTKAFVIHRIFFHEKKIHKSEKK